MSAPKQNKNASKPEADKRDSVLHIRIKSQDKGRLKANAYPRKVSEVVIETLAKAGLFD